jgi:hypothetical protein
MPRVVGPHVQSPVTREPRRPGRRRKRAGPDVEHYGGGRTSRGGRGAASSCSSSCRYEPAKPDTVTMSASAAAHTTSAQTTWTKPMQRRPVIRSAKGTGPSLHEHLAYVLRHTRTSGEHARIVLEQARAHLEPCAGAAVDGSCSPASVRLSPPAALKAATCYIGIPIRRLLAAQTPKPAPASGSVACAWRGLEPPRPNRVTRPSRSC